MSGVRCEGGERIKQYVIRCFLTEEKVERKNMKDEVKEKCSSFDTDFFRI